MQPVQKCGLSNVYAIHKDCQRCFPVGIPLYSHALRCEKSCWVLVNILSHSKALFILVLWISPVTMLMSLPWRASGETLPHIQWPRPLTRAGHTRLGAVSQPQACCVTVSQSLFCQVLFLSLLRWRQQYFCTSQWEHALVSQHALVSLCRLTNSVRTKPRDSYTFPCSGWLEQ